MDLLLALVAMTVAVLLALLWPLVRPRGPAAPHAPDLAIYKDQLAELGRDLERGLIRPEEAAAARLEVERRLLRAAGATDRRAASPAETTPRGRAAVLASAVLVPVLALGLYARLGAPELPSAGGRPSASVAAADGQAPPAAQAQAPGQPQLSVPEMVARLESRLAADPGDLEGWLMLGRSKGVLGDMPASVTAYREAQKLAADDPRVLGGLGESLIAAAGGVVTPEARGLLERLLQAGTTDPRARYYLALAAAQGGDNAKAVGLWRDLLAAAPADAPWRPQVEEAVRTAAGELGIDPSTVIVAAAPSAAAAPSPPTQTATADQAPPPAMPGPTAEDVAAAGKLSEGERSEFIRSMVGRLEARLGEDGGDVEGWRRLAQSRLVLGEQDKAREAYERGLALHPADSGLLKGYALLLLGPSRQPDGLPEVGDRAAELYQRAAAAAPDDPETQWFLGIRALQQGQKDEARDHWRRVLTRIEPSDPNYAAVKQQLDSLGG